MNTSAMAAIFGATSLISHSAQAQEASTGGDITSMVQAALQSLTNLLDLVLFYPVFGVPFLVLWLSAAGIYFTFRLGFVNFRLFAHGWAVAFGKYTRKDCMGEVTPFAAMAAAVAGTVGLGNIAGVAVAITAGGPGAVVWMMVAGFFGMSTRFAEATLGHKFRHKNAEGHVVGGAFYYLHEGLAQKNMAKFGKFLAVFFAVFCIGGAVGGGNMLQSNQLTATLMDSFGLGEWKLGIAIITTLAVGAVLIGGLKRIAHTAEAIVPVMALIYIVSGLVIIAVNIDLVPDAIAEMFRQAFTPGAAAGGVMGALIQGFRRAAFSNEAGVGSTPIVFAATKIDDPVQAGALAVITPFIDTLVVCFMTGLIITITGVYQTSSETGVVLTGQAFATVNEWFPMLLSVSVTLFAFSTMLTWSYYGERAWGYLFGDKHVILYHLLFCTLTFFGAMMQDKSNAGFSMIVDLSDLLLLSMAIPNLLGVYLLQKLIIAELKDYMKRLKAGEV
jgi:AGCS family alanine or glycine:cation symporter